MEAKYKVEGMTCGGCARSVTGAIEAADPRLGVVVSVEEGTVRVRGQHDQAAIKQSVEDAGFDFRGPAQAGR